MLVQPYKMSAVHATVSYYHIACYSVILSNNMTVVYDNVHYDLSDVSKIHLEVFLLRQMIELYVFVFNKSALVCEHFKSILCFSYH